MAATSRRGCAAVLDIGKTHAKVTLWSPERELIDRKNFRNNPVYAGAYMALDAAGLDAWLKEALTAFARQGEITAIVPITHGASGAVIEGDHLSLAPVDYESELPDALRRDYCARRDGFAVTGSPLLPCGLNLGAQFHWLEAIAPEKFARGTIVTWPQYWSWRLSGVAATEASSLGCHTDLWCPAQGRPSPMAASRGWAARFAPLHKADEVLGPVTAEWRACGLPADCAVVCGAHDSNTALLAARGYPEVGGRDCTTLSTGTWFIAMRSLAEGVSADALPEERDCLFNVDVAGLPVPSARFMGGREAQTIEAGEPMDVPSHAEELVATARRMVEKRVLAMPSFHKDVGPFPKHLGRWSGRPENQLERRAVAGLYLALVADVSLDLIGARGPIVVEGRFAGDPVFTGALTALRDRPVYSADAHDSISFGALHLIDGELPPQAKLGRCGRLRFDIADYAAAWSAHLTE